MRNNVTETETETATRRAQESRMRALAHANEIRRVRSDLKRQIAAGHVSAAELILEAPPAVLGWPLAKLLSQPRWGRAKCTAFLTRNQFAELKPIGTLTERQRRLVAAELQAAAPSITARRFDPRVDLPE
jgi:hypothetical protein